jgi:hypothetical protein
MIILSRSFAVMSSQALRYSKAFYSWSGEGEG